VKIVLPLVVVGVHGVDLFRRMGTMEVLERWERKGIVSGLAGLAVRKIRNREVIGIV
jgi:hypothetical protein